MSEWISVDDEMPRANINVLVTDGKSVGLSACRETRKEGKGFRVIHSGNDWECMADITHWMPLPEVP